MTDKEIIHKEVERLMNELIQEKEKGYGSDADDACILELQNVLTYIDSMQEKPVSTDILRKASEEYLKVLSETPYNNTPVTNAQTIIMELVSYLDNPSEYYPDHVTDVSKDLEEEIERYFTLWYDNEGGGCIKPDRWLNNLEDCMDIARHFAEWQKQQIMKGFPTWKKSEKLIEGALLDRGILYIPRYMIELSELKKLPKEVNND